MSDFAFLFEKRRALSDKVVALQSALAENPGDYALEKDLSSIHRLSKRYEEDILALSEQRGLDVLLYRIIPDNDGYSVAHVTQSLAGFQKVITGIYDYMLNGGKPIAHYPKSSFQQSDLKFGYTFEGSLGIALTIPNDRDLISGRFDGAASVFRDILDVGSKQDVIKKSGIVGRALMRQVYDWASANSEAQYSLEVIWRRSDGIERGEYIEREKMSQITDIISVAEEVESETIDVSGVLVGLNVKTSSGSFHLIVPNTGQNYRGRLMDSFQRSEQWGINKRYLAKIVKRTETRFDADQPKVSYALTALEKNDLYATE